MKLRYYDPIHNRLVYINKEATPDMWDDHWRLDDIAVRKALVNQGVGFVTRITERYLKPEDGDILEGGCGTGHHVAALTRKGYGVIGLDFAPHTVSILNQVIPELDIRLGDVRNLPIENASVAGYWSLGVIEHFYSGYVDIAKEMARVIRPGGYLFLTHPYMSPLRRLKAYIDLYPTHKSEGEPKNFYQFALDQYRVVTQFRHLGFTLCYFQPHAGFKGFKDEVPLMQKTLQTLYDYRGGNNVIRGFRFLIDRGFSKFSGHSCLMVFNKQ